MSILFKFSLLLSFAASIMVAANPMNIDRTTEIVGTPTNFWFEPRSERPSSTITLDDNHTIKDEHTTTSSTHTEKPTTTSHATSDHASAGVTVTATAKEGTTTTHAHESVTTLTSVVFGTSTTHVPASSVESVVVGKPTSSVIVDAKPSTTAHHGIDHATTHYSTVTKVITPSSKSATSAAVSKGIWSHASVPMTTSSPPSVSTSSVSHSFVSTASSSHYSVPSTTKSSQPSTSTSMHMTMATITATPTENAVEAYSSYPGESTDACLSFLHHAAPTNLVVFCTAWYEEVDQVVYPPFYSACGPSPTARISSACSAFGIPNTMTAAPPQPTAGDSCYDSFVPASANMGLFCPAWYAGGTTQWVAPNYQTACSGNSYSRISSVCTKFGYTSATAGAAFATAQQPTVTATVEQSTYTVTKTSVITSMVSGVHVTETVTKTSEMSVTTTIKECASTVTHTTAVSWSNTIFAAGHKSSAIKDDGTTTKVVTVTRGRKSNANKADDVTKIVTITSTAKAA